ncbi:MAG: undecaprenyl-phosphate glucose phosphotransferase [Deltaproteobacteria bacterium]|nr:undecaprenyl-phosphate glucose phosphotransferase [Deltaproteobacteria bacterium]
MLRRRHEIFRGLLLLGDLLLVGASWLGAYALRFHAGFPVPLGIPPVEPYLSVLVLLLPGWAWVFRSRGLYAPQRVDSPLSEVAAVAAAGTTVVVLLVVAGFFVRSYFFSRGAVLLFWGLSVTSVAVFRLVAREVLFALHRRGRHLSSALVVGGGRLAEQVIDRIHERPQLGLRVVGVLAEARSPRVRGVPVLGRYEQVKPVLHLCGARQVVLALPREDAERLEPLLDQLEDELVDIRLVPDVLHLATLGSSIEDFDGLPVINLRESPLVGWAAIQKRLFDVAVSALLLAVATPVMAVIALAIRLTSGAPVLYRQERMGLDGHVFRMLKFRTMVDDAERDTGPVWARRDDPRETRVGSFLRRTSLDELPQLWNVLSGEMSLVGPRPERPVFIEQFRREVPGYMLRHKVKAGLTGWAQVHRWRGDTSLHERIEHDLYYIRNWSLGLDVRILLMTLWRVRLPD